jgi:hypothetical protein
MPHPFKFTLPRKADMPCDASIDAFTDALWLEDGLSLNTLTAYRRDLGSRGRGASWPTPTRPT